MLAGLVVASGASVALWYLITHVLAHLARIGSANRHIDAWLAA